MEKRTLYIITSLIILALLSGLAFWYLHTLKQELSLNEITELDLHSTEQGSIINDTQSLGANNRSFNNFGLNNTSELITPTNNDINSTDVTEDESGVVEEEPETWELIQIYSNPVSGASIIEDSIQFTDSKTGNISEWSVGGIEDRLSSITISDIDEAYTLSQDSTLIIHHNKPPSLIKMIGEESIITETDYLDTMLQIVQSGKYLYYTTPNNSGVILKSTQDVSKVLWSSPLSNWLLQSIDDYIVITQKSSHNIPGYSYLLSKAKLGTNNLSLMPLAQDLPGLLVNVSPDATQLLYSTVGNRGLTLNLKDTSTKEIIPLSIKTLASKCTWSNDGSTFYCAVPTNINSRIIDTLPNSWHKGQFSFRDNLWRINPSTGDAIRLAHATGLDIIDLQEGSDGKIILFKNKTDQSLWAVISSKLK